MLSTSWNPSCACSSCTAGPLALSVFSTLLATLSSPIHTILYTCIIHSDCPCGRETPMLCVQLFSTRAFSSVVQRTSRHPKQRASSKTKKITSVDRQPPSGMKVGHACPRAKEAPCPCTVHEVEPTDNMQKTSKRYFQSQRLLFRCQRSGRHDAAVPSDPQKGSACFGYVCDDTQQAIRMLHHEAQKGSAQAAFNLSMSG